MRLQTETKYCKNYVINAILSIPDFKFIKNKKNVKWKFCKSEYLKTIWDLCYIILSHKGEYLNLRWLYFISSYKLNRER